MDIRINVFALAAMAGCGSPDTGGATTDDGEDAGTTESPVTLGSGAVTTSDPESPGDSRTTGDTTTTGGPASTGGGSTATGPMTTGGDESSTGETDTGGPWAAGDCPEVFAQELLPTFEIQLSADELAAIEAEWLVADDDNTPEHPVELFTYEDTVITDATVRLRGNAKWWPGQGKMQFEVTFDTHDQAGRFMGLRHLVFDAARENRTFLRDRLALHILRDVGVPAPCANNARVVLNGEYYGLFTSLEKVDVEFLARVFEAPHGNLYKRAGWARKTNTGDDDESDIAGLLAADDIAELDAAMNLEEAVLEWATEAILPHSDGAWAGGLNYYVYNDPLSGFTVIPWDLDATFSKLPSDTDPYAYIKPDDVGRPFYALAMADPAWFAAYLAAIEHALAVGYDVAVLQARMDAWSAQIEAAAEDDPNKPFTDSQFHDATASMRKYVENRAEFLAEWLECWQSGGVDLDGDMLCDA